MKKTVEIVSERVVYDGFFGMEEIQFRQSTPDGGMSPVITREVFQRGHAAALLGYDPRTDMVLVIDEFRVGHLGAGFKDHDCWSAGPVAGMIDEGEDPRDCVVREAAEEAGVYVSKEDLIGPITAFSSPGGTSEMLSFFIAPMVLDQGELTASSGLAGEGEFTSPRLASRSEMLNSLFEGPCNGHLAILLMWLERLIAQGQFENMG